MRKGVVPQTDFRDKDLATYVIGRHKYILELKNIQKLKNKQIGSSRMLKMSFDDNPKNFCPLEIFKAGGMVTWEDECVLRRPKMREIDYFKQVFGE